MGERKGAKARYRPLELAEIEGLVKEEIEITTFAMTEMYCDSRSAS
jgi:hypothetical protein